MSTTPQQQQQSTTVTCAAIDPVALGDISASISTSCFFNADHSVSYQPTHTGAAGTTDARGVTTGAALFCSPEWQLDRKLGGGGFGDVYLGYRKNDPDKSLRAIKIARASSGTIRELEHEIELLLLMPSHPNVVQPLHFSKFEGGTQLVMEYCRGGSLLGWLEAHGPMTEDRVREYARQVLVALGFLHRTGVLHRDLKPHNILLGDTEGTIVKLVDFGLSSTMNGSGATPGGGTARYMSPEAYQGTVSAATDLWSLGATVTHLLTGVRPWSDKLPDDVSDFWRLRSLICAVPLDEADRSNHHPTIPQTLSDDGAAFLKQVFALDYQARGTAQQLLSHAWFRPTNNSSPSSSAAAAAAAAASSVSSLAGISIGVGVGQAEALNAQLLADAVQHVEAQSGEARLWSCVGRLLPADESVVVAGETLSRRMCLLRACLLEPNRLLWWNMLGRDLQMLGRMQWYSVGPGTVARRAQSPTVNDVEVDATYCFVNCLEIAPDSAVGWRNLGLTLNGPGATARVNGQEFTKQQCYLRAVNLEPTQAASFTNVGVTLSPFETVAINGETFDKIGCSAAAWGNIGNLMTKRDETVTVGQRQFTKLQCQINAVTFSPAAPQMWNNLGAAIPSGQVASVAGREVTKLQCYLTALALDPQNAARWRHVGFHMQREDVPTLTFDHASSGKISVTRRDCYVKAAALEPTKATRWSELGAVLGPSDVVDVNDAFKGMTRVRCLCRAVSLDPTDAHCLYTLAQSMTGPDDRAEIDGTALSAADLTARVIGLCADFYNKADEFYGERVTSHERLCQCDKGHPMLPFRSATWRCDCCRGHDAQTGALSCRACDLDVCFKCLAQALAGVSRSTAGPSMTHEVSAGPAMTPTVSQASFGASVSFPGAIHAADPAAGPSKLDMLLFATEPGARERIRTDERIQRIALGVAIRQGTTSAEGNGGLVEASPSP